MGVRAYKKERMNYKNMSDTLWAQFRQEKNLVTAKSTTPAFTTTTKNLESPANTMQSVGDTSI